MTIHEQVAAIIGVLHDPQRWKQYPDLPYDKLLELARDESRVDLFRAIMALVPEGERSSVFKAMSEVIRRVFSDRVRAKRYPTPQDDMLDAIQFNNHPDTTHEDVLRVLKLTSMPTFELGQK